MVGSQATQAAMEDFINGPPPMRGRRNRMNAGVLTSSARLGNIRDEGERGEISHRPEAFDSLHQEGGKILREVKMAEAMRRSLSHLGGQL